MSSRSLLLIGRFSFHWFRFEFQPFPSPGHGDPHPIPDGPVGEETVNIVDAANAVLVDRDDEIPFLQACPTRWSCGIDRYDLDAAI